LPLLFALAVGRARWRDLHRRIEPVKSMSYRARGETTIPLRVVEKTSEVPLRPVLRDVLWARGPGCISNGEGALRGKLKVRDAFCHVRAAVHPIDAVAQRGAACEHGSPCRRAHSAATVAILHQDGASALRPLRHAWRVSRAVVPREVRPACGRRLSVRARGPKIPPENAIECPTRQAINVFMSPFLPMSSPRIMRNDGSPPALAATSGRAGSAAVAVVLASSNRTVGSLHMLAWKALQKGGGSRAASTPRRCVSRTRCAANPSV
jgi:hypothetical protein